MRRLFSNLVVILLGLLGVTAKWGGLVMDIIGLPEAGSQLDKWISQLEIGNGAYILIVVSVVLLLIINGSAIKRAVLKPKARVYGIEELQELSGVLSPISEGRSEGRSPSIQTLESQIDLSKDYHDEYISRVVVARSKVTCQPSGQFRAILISPDIVRIFNEGKKSIPGYARVTITIEEWE